MSTAAHAENPAPAQPAQPRYHHGDLRASLLAEARRLLERDGRSWTVRDAARGIGVSSGAPYRHFDDKAEIERELAAIGFAELIDANAWLDWARANPQLYALIFSSGMCVFVDLKGVSLDAIREFHGNASTLLWLEGSCK